MSDVQRCDACGVVRFRHNTAYSLASAVADIESNPQAIDVHQKGHLCDECAFAVAKLIRDLGADDE